MSQKYYQAKGFKNLKDEWYARLQKEGFEDAEQDEIYLKQTSIGASSSVSKRALEVSTTSREEYYRYVGQFLYDYKFQTEREREIWALHTEGTSIREIVKHFQSKKIPTGKDRVQNLIKKVAKEMFKAYGITAKE